MSYTSAWQTKISFASYFPSQVAVKFCQYPTGGAFVIVKGERAAEVAGTLIEISVLAHLNLTRKPFYLEAPSHLLGQQYNWVVRKLRRTFPTLVNTFTWASLYVSGQEWFVGMAGDIWAYEWDGERLHKPLPKVPAARGIPAMGNFRVATGENVPGKQVMVVNRVLASTLNETKLQTLISTPDNLQAIAENLVQTAVKRRKNTYAALIADLFKK